MKEPKGSRNCEWMVTPLALSAAMPVGARITKRLCVLRASWWRKVVLPVPAFPVRKTWRAVLFTKRAASAAISVVSRRGAAAMAAKVGLAWGFSCAGVGWPAISVDMGLRGERNGSGG